MRIETLSVEYIGLELEVSLILEVFLEKICLRKICLLKEINSFSILNKRFLKI